MKTTPILFSAPMIRAIISRQKTQTSRTVTPQPPEGWGGASAVYALAQNSRYGVAGDQLRVRETWGLYNDEGMPYFYATGIPKECPPGFHVKYAADEPVLKHPRWRPSIHMPTWASRITLEITEVRVERLQDISEEDCWAEGVASSGVCYGNTILPSTATGKERFHALWDSINGEKKPGKPDISWAVNPWIWAISFNVIKG